MSLELITGDSKTHRWVRAHLDYAGDWCLIWPFSKVTEGYAYVWAAGRTHGVHRVMCEHVHGPAPTPKHQAAHSCGRGHEGCVNPRHVSWKTNAENQLERYATQGGAQKRRKLMAEDVVKIRALAGLETQDTTAKRFGVSVRNIQLIQTGQTWKHSRFNQREFTEAEVREIRSTPWKMRKTTPMFAAKFGVSRNVICKIRDRETYVWVEDISPLPRAQDTERR